MIMLKKMIPPLLALAAGMAVAPAQASDFLWSDTYLNYRFLWQDKQPGSPKDTKENAVNLTHADEWAYGSNVVSLDIEQFSHQDPSNAASGTTSTGSTGSGEFYGLFRSTFSGNKIFTTQAFSFGPIKDIGLDVGADWCTQNDQFASNKKMIVVGTLISIDMPKGYWTVSLHMAHEWNTNGYHSNSANGDGSDNFDLVPELETAWLYPFSLGPLPLKFTGYGEVVGPKNKGDALDSKHTNEYLAHPKLMLDVGAVAGGASNKIDAGVGYEYWLNKFGSQKPLEGTVQNAVFFEVGYHFD
jgi:hypothetical protein